MSRNHQEIQEELTLWALGVAPDLPLTSLVEHLAACDECRRLVHETYEIAGQLAAGVELRRPPEGLKTKLLERVRARDPLLLEGADATTLFGNHVLRLPQILVTPGWPALHVNRRPPRAARSDHGSAAASRRPWRSHSCSATSRSIDISKGKRSGSPPGRRAMRPTPAG